MLLIERGPIVARSVASAAMSAQVKKLFGERLVVLRKKRGWSQEELALQTEIARSYLSGVERGVRNISLVNICKLAIALQVEPLELLRFPNGLADVDAALRA
jgi:transcriptional regulator with XRE-family HTH domain